MFADFKIGIRVAATIFFACIMCFFVYVSVDVMVNSISTEVIGYSVIDNETGEEVEFLAELPSERNENYRYISKYSERPFAADVAVTVFQVICGLGVFFCTAGSVVAKVAARDRNDVDFNDSIHDKTKGLRIGLFAAIPALVVYALGVAVKLLPYSGVGETYFWLYRWIFTTPVKPIVDWFINDSINLQSAPLSGILLSGIFVPLIVAFCAVMYLICYNEDSVIAKVLYKSAQKNDKTQRGIRR